MLLAEYAEVSGSWRFLTGLRFALLAFNLTLLSALLGAYQTVVSHLGEPLALGQRALAALLTFGYLGTLAIMMFDSAWNALRPCVCCVARR